MTGISLEAYLAWREVPLITTVLIFEALALPSGTQCSQGRGFKAEERMYSLQFENYLKKKGKDLETMNDEEKQEE